MDRRSFLKSTGAALASSALSTSLKAQAPLASGRSIYPINRGWRYSPHVVPGGHQPGFDDSAFTTVVIPHTNVALPWHGFDDKTYEFISLYRRPLRLPADLRR